MLSRTPRISAFLLLCIFVLLQASLFARARAEDNTPDFGSAHPASVGAHGESVILNAPQPSIVIPRLDTAPKLSDFLASPVRSPAASEMLRITQFVEHYPVDGHRPSDPTTAYLGYTHRYLFVAFVCTDHDPKLIRAHMMPRDDFGNDDGVQVILDTFHDQRRAFSFSSNALGIQSDALYTEQSGYDHSFDTVWDTWAHRTPTGYVVLFRIPFSSLYFSKSTPGEMRTWGIILGRGISHLNESDFWPAIHLNIAGFLSQDVAVEGFANIAHGRNLQLEPYSLARNLRQLNVVNPDNPYFQSKSIQNFTGLDAKLILHNSLVLDATVNPDFSQVGVNDPATPNQRFPPYFPEVRPFFIENSSYFDTPISLYYSNNIVTPQYGARLTGKLGDWAMGILGVDDRSPGQAVAAGNPEYGTRAHDYIGRINRDVGSLSDVGIIYADREYLGSYNRAGGVDYRVRIGKAWTLTGQGLTSETENISNGTDGEQECETYALSCSGQAWAQSVSYSDPHRNFWTSYDDTAAGFVTDTGFFRRPDMRQTSAHLGYTFRPNGGPVLSDGPSIYAERSWDHHGVPLGVYVSPAWSINFSNSTSVYAGFSVGQSRLRPIDYSALPADVEYKDHSTNISIYTAPVSWLTLHGSYSQGTTVNYSPPSGQGPGPVSYLSPNFRAEFKLFNGADMQNSYTFTHFANIDNGSLVYDDHQIVSRWNYQFTKAASINLIGQYIATLPEAQYTSLTNSKTIFADALFTYMPHPGTALYLGYIGNFANIDPSLCTRTSAGACNPSDPILAPTPSSLTNDGKNLYVKVSYLLRF
jgi:Domain of unknown function (DUF5916)